ncbi:MAG TPA: hypothetical protein ENK24_08385 [Anaerolineae bacterium]|nr:hypothetical protein [Anaerolineae bacterium]
MGAFLLLFLIILVIVLVVQAIVLAWAIGVGWLLTLFLPFSLFEGALLGIISAGMVAFALQRILSSEISPFSDYDDDDDEGELFDVLDSYEVIPENRFYKDKTGKTWEAWVKHEIANGIYEEMQDSDITFASMGKQQLQELAIRLADIGIAVLKTKAKNRTLRVTVANLRNRMKKINQRPYDDDILELAAEAINDELEYEETIDVIRGKLWRQPCDMFD